MIDLTRQYQNLLQKEEAGGTQTYLWDGNVAGMWEERKHPVNGEACAFQTSATQYYFQDELGRFAGVDRIKGFTAAPMTLNEYGYCWNNPMLLVDLDGALPQCIEFGKKVLMSDMELAKDGFKYVFGIDTVLYETEVGEGSYKISRHKGGDIIVFENQVIGGTPQNPIMQFNGLSVNANINIPKTNISFNQSISWDPFDITAWEYSYTAMYTDEQTNNYTEGGWSLDINGVNTKFETGGAYDVTSNSSYAVSEEIIDSRDDLSWSLTTVYIITQIGEKLVKLQ